MKIFSLKTKTRPSIFIPERNGLNITMRNPCTFLKNYKNNYCDKKVYMQFSLFSFDLMFKALYFR